jgi:hypothetical protein
MNDQRRRFGTALAAGALTLMIPAVASAQDAASDPQPAPPPMQAPADANPGVAAQSDQLDRLEALGFVSANSVATAQVDASNAPAYGWTPDRFQSTLDRVMVSSGDDTAPQSLREYLAANGVDPASVVGVQVLDNTVVIVHG